MVMVLLRKGKRYRGSEAMAWRRMRGRGVSMHGEQHVRGLWRWQGSFYGHRMQDLRRSMIAVHLATTRLLAP